MDTASKLLQERTDAKLRYAEVHVQALQGHGPPDGSDFDKAHQESYLFHLFGARDAFLAELNHYYQAALPTTNLTVGKLRAALAAISKHSEELSTLYRLEQDHSSWFSRAKTMRDHSAHVQGVARAYHLGGARDGQVLLRSPDTGALADVHSLIELRLWHTNMLSLIAELRASALATTTS